MKTTPNARSSPLKPLGNILKRRRLHVPKTRGVFVKISCFARQGILNGTHSKALKLATGTIFDAGNFLRREQFKTTTFQNISERFQFQFQRIKALKLEHLEFILEKSVGTNISFVG